jgi:tRNA nucleotidyltransferase/poly(A) polymerase
MNENINDQEKDIKPVRPGEVSNRDKRVTKGGGVLFSSMLTLLNLAGLIILSFWFFNTSGNQQQAGQNFIQRISSLEEGLIESGDNLKALTQDVDSDLKFVNKEVRKLWDLSNKRNRKEIAVNLNSIEKLVIQYDEILKKNETLSAKQRAVSLELAKLANMQQKTSEAIEGFNGISNESSNKEQIDEIEESIKSFNVYRVQVNQSLLSIKEKLNELELLILDTQNE